MSSSLTGALTGALDTFIGILFDADKIIVGPFEVFHQRIEFCIDGNRMAMLRIVENTIRNVTIVVAVSITSCHVSVK